MAALQSPVLVSSALNVHGGGCQRLEPEGGTCEEQSVAVAVLRGCPCAWKMSVRPLALGEGLKTRTT